MAGFVDKAVGLYHFISDRMPKNIPLVNAKPRAVNPWCSNGQVLVAKVMAGADIRFYIDRLTGSLRSSVTWSELSKEATRF